MAIKNLTEVQDFIDKSNISVPKSRAVNTADRQFSVLVRAPIIDHGETKVVTIDIFDFIKNSESSVKVGNTIDRGFTDEDVLVSTPHTKELDTFIKALIKKIDCSFIISMMIGDVKSYIQQRLPVFYKILNSIVVKEDFSIGTLCVGWNPSLDNFLMRYNPEFIIEAGISDYIHNRANYRQGLASAVFYFFVFGFTHEVSHILRLHHQNRDTTIYDVDPGLVNSVGDAYINNELVTYLEDKAIVSKPTIPSLGIIKEDIFTSYINPQLYNKPIRDVFLDIANILKSSTGYKIQFSQSHAFGSASFTKIEDAKDPDIVKIVYPTGTANDVFLSSAVMINFINDLLNYLTKERQQINKDQDQSGQGDQQQGDGQQGDQQQGQSQQSQSQSGSGQDQSGGSQKGDKQQDKGDNSNSSQPGQQGDQEKGSQGSGGSGDKKDQQDSNQKDSSGSGQGDSKKDQEGQKDSQSQSGSGSSNDQGQDKSKQSSSQSQQGSSGQSGQQGSDQNSQGSIVDRIKATMSDASSQKAQDEKENGLDKDAQPNSSDNKSAKQKLDSTLNNIKTQDISQADAKILGDLNLGSKFSKMVNQNDWESQLSSLLSNALSTTCTYDSAIPNARIQGQLGRDIDIKKIKDVIFAIDCSGSMGSEQFQSSLTQINTFLRLQDTSDMELHVVYWGSTIFYKKYTVDKKLMKKLIEDSKDLGATPLSPCMDLLVKKFHDFDVCIFFTDGELTERGAPNKKHVQWFKYNQDRIIWVLTKNGTLEGGIKNYDKTAKQRMIKQKKNN